MSSRRKGNSFLINHQEIKQYHDEGYVELQNVLTEQECKSLDPWFDHFTSGSEAERIKKDCCDMSQPDGLSLIHI